MQIISTNITSPLGMTTEDNYQAVKAGQTGVKCHEAGERGVPFAFCASLFESQPDFATLALQSAREAVSRVSLPPQRTVFILSTTKGDLVTPLGTIAQGISRQLGIATQPIVVCNACISGVAAQVLAMRLLHSGYYDYAVITGADVQTDFIISGFHSLKALSPQPCRPFDIERLGLNLGEAAATMVVKRETEPQAAWHITEGAITNDAYHISGPHPKGEGAYRALASLSHSGIACVGVHGTATMYNDQMESKAIERASFSDIPLSALKGYYGHTMGAAGLLETIITARALDDGLILPSRGYAEPGVSGRVTISADMLHTSKRAFIKILSGFGGCNGAVRVERSCFMPTAVTPAVCRDLGSVSIQGGATGGVTLNGRLLPVTHHGKDMLVEIYKTHIGDYPKFHKMDTLSKLAFIAARLLMGGQAECSVILFNRTSSVVSDARFRNTIASAADYYPSPAVFVYTLPNICTGEIALRHGSHAETSFFVLPCRDPDLMRHILSATFATHAGTALTGWIDCPDDDDFECEVELLGFGF